MKSKKIAMLFPYAPAYRGPIYEQMDEAFDIDWFFCGDAKRPLKLYDYSKLNNCNLSMSERKLIGPFNKYAGIKNLHLENYDAIIAPTVIRNTSMWWLVRHFGGGKKGPRLFFWTHGWYGRERGITRIIKTFFYSKVDGFFLYNNRAKQLMIKEGFPEDKLYVIYNSLNYKAQAPLRNSLRESSLYYDHFRNSYKNIVFIGRLTKEKRFDLLLDAICILKDRGEFFNVTFIGDGEERVIMEERVEKLGLGNTVWFYGACFDEEKNAELIFNADLCVSPGNIGLTAIHVLMFGCPVITSDDFNNQGPEFEAIHEGQTGLFFKSEDSESLASAISEWFNIHGKDRGHIRLNCYKEVDLFWNPDFQISVINNALTKF